MAAGARQSHAHAQEWCGRAVITAPIARLGDVAPSPGGCWFAPPGGGFGVSVAGHRTGCD